MQKIRGLYEIGVYKYDPATYVTYKMHLYVLYAFFCIYKKKLVKNLITVDFLFNIRKFRKRG